MNTTQPDWINLRDGVVDMIGVDGPFPSDGRYVRVGELPSDGGEAVVRCGVWQPIETVPEGEAVLLAYKFGIGVAIGHKDDEGVFYGHEGSNWGNGVARFSHWMPLPDVPQGDKP